MCAIGEPSGPILKGITYSVRPRIQPLNRPVSVSFISLGLTQLLVGPASVLLREQMKVRSSTRATSLGSERARKLLGRFSALSRIRVPALTIWSHRRSYSSCDPSHQYTWSGRHSATISSTHARSFALVT